MEDDNTEYYGVYVPSPELLGPSTGAVFSTLRDASKFANTPEAKSRGKCSKYRGNYKHSIRMRYL